MTVALPDTASDASASASDTREVEARDLYLAFGKKKVLDGFSFSLKRGESIVILGRSGTGKSVFLKCLLGLLSVNRGEMLWQGAKLGQRTSQRGGEAKQRKSFAEFRAGCGMLFQSSALFDSLPVWENVAFGLMAAGRVSRTEALDLAITRLEEVELPPETAHLFPAELSGGMRKRVGLARAVASEPKILLFDEPTSGLDPIMTRIIDDLILNSMNRLGASAITVTHDMASAGRIANKVALLHGGRIVWHGSAEALQDPQDPALRQFVRGEADGPLAAQTRAGEQD